jgi:hypothetical protein
MESTVSVPLDSQISISAFSYAAFIFNDANISRVQRPNVYVFHPSILKFPTDSFRYNLSSHQTLTLLPKKTAFQPGCEQIGFVNFMLPLFPLEKKKEPF